MAQLISTLQCSTGDPSEEECIPEQYRAKQCTKSNLVKYSALLQQCIAEQIWKTVRPFLLFEQIAVQSTTLFLFRKVDNILQTSSVVKKSAASTVQQYMAVSDRLNSCLEIIADGDGYK